MPAKHDLEDAIQPRSWFSKLPRPEFAALPKMDTSEAWFEIYQLPHNVFALYEPGHFQEVISYLVPGKDKALLFDTGLGIANIKTAVEELTSLEIVVVNSHTHFDHIGDNHRFPVVHVFDHPCARARLARGMRPDELAVHLGGDAIWMPVPARFDPAAYHIPACRFETIADGHIFELGGRRLETLSTPGHSPDSIMLLDRENRLLLTGDTLYPAVLYAHLEGSDFNTYRETMTHLTKLVPEVDFLYCSHNTPVHAPQLLIDAHNAFESIAAGKAGYEIDRNGIRLYAFEGFSIATPDDDNIVLRKGFSDPHHPSCNSAEEEQ